jgi:hypothetical protein
LPVSAFHSGHETYSSPSVSESRAPSEVEHVSHVNQPHEEAANTSGGAQMEFLKGYRNDAEFLGNSSAEAEGNSHEASSTISHSNSEPGPLPSASQQPRELRSVPGDRNLKFTAAKQQLQPHFEQRKTDQEALSKWNTNGQGRNQGVVHLLDYGYARPSNLSLGNKKDVMKQNGLSGEQYDALSKADHEGRGSFTHHGLTDPNKDYKLTNDQVKGLVKNKYLEPVETPERKNAQGEVQKAQEELEGLIKQKTAELKNAGVKGKEFGNQLNEFKKTDPSYLAKDKQLNDAKSKEDAVTHYRTTSDESKRGRLERIANAGGKDSLERGKEIEDGTHIVSGLMNQENLKNAQKKDPPASLQGWQRTGEGKWKEQEIPQSELKHTVSADFEGNGLAVKTWGTLDDPNADPSEHAGNLGISTLMGSNKK